MIHLKDLHKDYINKGAVTNALRGINLTIEKGEFLAIVGTSGSGKTTLLNILGGMDIATSGQYFYNNEPISTNGKELQRFRREYISFVFQDFELLDDYTVFENVEMPLVARRVNKNIRKSKVEKALEYVGLDKAGDRKTNELSGGQKQRCAIARAIAIDNPIILADEPTGSLDKKNSEIVMDIFEKINAEGKTVVIITHDETVAERCERIVRIEDGKVVDERLY